tara:strand:+ start:7185 stop:8636 length:1452 start_codon:yes stop_codon:yes gene_type:complete
MTTVLPNLVPALPEMIMAVGAMALLMLGVFRGNKSTGQVSWLAAVLMLVVMVIVAGAENDKIATFGDMFVVDGFTIFMKVLVLLASALAVLMSLPYLRAENIERFEYPILIALATLGMMVMVSANDLMTMYMGIEMQSLALYVMAAFRRDTAQSTEAGLKYFVLGALSSGMLLYGASLVYGFTGTTNFTVLANVLHGHEGHGPSLGVIFGLVFVAAGLAFKISAVPFHMWTPDVYEGAPTPVTAFFAVAPKVAALALLTRTLFVPFGDMAGSWQQIVIFMAIASMFWGSIAAVIQTNIKRLMAFSSIGHVGFALVGIAAGSPAGIKAMLIYMAIYLVMNVGAFVCILSMRREQGLVDDIDELAGLSRTQPAMAAALAIFMLSLAGIPPLAGFFGKFYVFSAAIDAGYYTLAILGVLASVIGAYYYLRIVKIMYFDEPVGAFEPLKAPVMSMIMMASAIFIVLFVFLPAPLRNTAEAAAQALLH